MGFSQAEQFFIDKIRFRRGLSDEELALLATEASDAEHLNSLMDRGGRAMAEECISALREDFEAERFEVDLKLKIYGCRAGMDDLKQLEIWWQHYNEIVALNSRTFLSGAVQTFYLQTREADKQRMAQAKLELRKSMGCASSVFLFAVILTLAAIAYSLT